MPEKIVQLNEEVIKGQLKEDVYKRQDLLYLILNFIKQKQDILQEQKFCIVWNQADNKERQDVAIHLIKRLKDHKIRSVASSFWI